MPARLLVRRLQACWQIGWRAGFATHWAAQSPLIQQVWHDVYAEVARRHLGLPELSAILPGYAPGPELGLFA